MFLGYICNVKKYTNTSFFMALAVFLLFANVSLADDNRQADKRDSTRVHKMIVIDHSKSKDTNIRSLRMAKSAFPVQLEVKGSALCVTSDYTQSLPIYTRGGTLFMSMRLNKGKNWLNGLPRGRYLINNLQVFIP